LTNDPVIGVLLETSFRGEPPAGSYGCDYSRHRHQELPLRSRETCWEVGPERPKIPAGLVSNLNQDLVFGPLAFTSR